MGNLPWPDTEAQEAAGIPEHCASNWTGEAGIVRGHLKSPPYHSLHRIHLMAGRVPQGTERAAVKGEMEMVFVENLRHAAGVLAEVRGGNIPNVLGREEVHSGDSR